MRFNYETRVALHTPPVGSKDKPAQPHIVVSGLAKIKDFFPIHFEVCLFDFALSISNEQLSSHQNA